MDGGNEVEHEYTSQRMQLRQMLKNITVDPRRESLQRLERVRGA
jgi:hypothetical protein